MRVHNLIIITGVILVIFACQQQTPIRHQNLIINKPTFKKASVVTDIICIAAVGDIMLGSSYPDHTKLPPDSAVNSFKAAQNELHGANIVFGNLEGTLLDGGKPAAYKKKLATAYLFRMPVAYGLILKKAGFNLLSIANNHITDFGQRGCISTTKTLDMDAIHYAGLEDHPFTIFKINGITYGFCAFAPCAHTVSIFNLAAAAVIIRNLKKQCDIVIVSFHGGAEGPLYEHIPFKMESHLNGKRGNVYIFAHNAINAGADVVFGSGPHVSRALELYQNHLIAYSLGNFCTYKSVSVTGVCGMAPLLKVYMNKEGKFLGGKIIAFRQTHEDGLVHDSLNHVINRINLVTKKDFPNSGLLISRDGKISAAESVKMN